MMPLLPDVSSHARERIDGRTHKKDADLLALLLLLRGPRRGIGIRVVVFCITMAGRRHGVYSRVAENRAIKSLLKESEHAKGDSLER